ncbi:MAG: hypothetical protein AB7I27_00050 [Bacteriovoracaceae bacterium]
MKKLKYSILIFAFINTAQASAQTQWVQTAFWRAPKVTEFKISLRPNNSILEECDRFKKIMYSEDGSLRWVTKYPEKVARFREAIGPALFILETGSQGRIEQELNIATDEEIEDALPFFTRNQATTVTALDIKNVYTIKTRADSYTEISKSLSLPDTIIESIKDSNGFINLKIKGLDLACDLLEGKVALETKSPSYVYLKEDQSRNLLEMYNNKILPIFKDVLARKELSQIKAARIGFRLGKLIEEEYPKNTEVQAENKLMGIMKTLIKIPSFEISSNVQMIDKTPLINFSSSADAGIATIKLEN